jgi:hypothetical protein
MFGFCDDGELKRRVAMAIYRYGHSLISLSSDNSDNLPWRAMGVCWLLRGGTPTPATLWSLNLVLSMPGDEESKRLPPT